MNNVVNTNMISISITEPKSLDKLNRQQSSNIISGNGVEIDSESLTALVAHTVAPLANVNVAQQSDAVQDVYQGLVHLALQTGDENLQGFVGTLHALEGEFQGELVSATQQDNVAEAAVEVKQAYINVKTNAGRVLSNYVSAVNDGNIADGGTGYQVGGDASDINALLTLLKDHKGNILVAAMLLMLFLSEQQRKVMSVDGQIALVNKQYSDDLGDALAAWTGIDGITLPYKDPISGTVCNSLFEIFKLAYGPQGKTDPKYDNLRASLDPAYQYFGKIMHKDGKSFLDELNEDNWSSQDDESKFNAMLDGVKARVEDDRLHINPHSAEFPFLKKDDKGNYTVDKNTTEIIQQMMTGYKEGVTEGNNISSKLYAQMNADSTTYQQDFQGAIKFIEAYAQISNSIWAR